MALFFATIAPTILESSATSTRANLTVITKVVGSGPGITLRPASDFTILVSGNNANPLESRGNESGTTVTLGTGEYDVSVVNPPADYLQEYSADCRGTITLANETKTCNITNTIPSNIEFTSTIEVTKIVTPRLEAGDVFIMEVRGAPANPSKFGMLPGTTTVKVIGGNIYEIVETSMPPQLTGSHIAHYSDGCKGSITFQEVKSCVIENKPSERVNCLDGMDNDGDGRRNLNDEDCLAPPPPPHETVCNDGQDNDRDGGIDTADEDCIKPTLENPTGGDIAAAREVLFKGDPERLESCMRHFPEYQGVCLYLWGPRYAKSLCKLPGCSSTQTWRFLSCRSYR